jgi:hypothetical protein
VDVLAIAAHGEIMDVAVERDRRNGGLPIQVVVNERKVLFAGATQRTRV